MISTGQTRSYVAHCQEDKPHFIQTWEKSAKIALENVLATSVHKANWIKSS